MNVKYTLRYLLAAQEDLISIFDYIAQDSPSRALTFVEKLDKRIKLLEDQPRLGRVPRHQRFREEGYRVLFVESYLAFYKIRKGTIEIHRVVHGARNLDFLI